MWLKSQSRILQKHCNVRSKQTAFPTQSESNHDCNYKCGRIMTQNCKVVTDKLNVRKICRLHKQQVLT